MRVKDHDRCEDALQYPGDPLPVGILITIILMVAIIIIIIIVIVIIIIIISNVLNLNPSSI